MCKSQGGLTANIKLYFCLKLEPYHTWVFGKWAYRLVFSTTPRVYEPQSLPTVIVLWSQLTFSKTPSLCFTYCQVAVDRSLVSKWSSLQKNILIEWLIHSGQSFCLLGIMFDILSFLLSFWRVWWYSVENNWVQLKIVEINYMSL